MKRKPWLYSLAVLGLLALTAGTATAERVPMTRSRGQRVHWTRPDITVPYLTNRYSAFGAWTVSPIIYSSPIVDDPAHPQARAVYNLQFYGSVQSFGTRSNGAVLRLR
jgi:hypothetical protein